MIRNNLSTRPFYNTAAVRLSLAVAVAIVLLATGLNVVQVLRYSNSNTELVTRAQDDEVRAADLRRSAQKLRASVDLAQVESVSVDARQANDLIERRTFSWTELFNRFEHTLPDDVRITAVHPTVGQERRIVLAVTVLARGVDDVNLFMENLDRTNAFAELHSRQERVTDSGQIESSLEMIYQPQDITPAVPAAAAAAAAPGDGR